jgi:cytochrome c-type biogenesis protein CcmH
MVEWMVEWMVKWMAPWIVKRVWMGVWAPTLTLTLALCLTAAPSLAKEAVPVAADAAQEARVMALAAELRCLVCQNQTIADSHADLAVDLRSQIREMLAKGQSDDQIRAYMTDRYGDFVLYKPPFKATTALLWAGPPLLLLTALGGLFVMLRKRQRASPDAFDPDTDDEPQPTR